jgi:hypothetical protein
MFTHAKVRSLRQDLPPGLYSNNADNSHIVERKSVSILRSEPRHRARSAFENAFSYRISGSNIATVK